jgi:hypothetical protein
MLKFLFWAFILLFVAPVLVPLLLAAAVVFLVTLPILLVCVGVKAVLAIALFPLRVSCGC